MLLQPVLAVAGRAGKFETKRPLPGL